MKRFFRYTTAVFLICSLIFTLSFITGCGKNQDASAITPTTPGLPGAGQMPGQTMPQGMPQQPGMRGPVMPGQGMPNIPTYPGTPQMPGAATSAPTGTTPSAKRQKITVVEFNQLALASPAKTVTVKEGNTSIQFLRFKYTDWQGKVWQCEMPASEAKVARSEGAWLATFDVYKKESTTAAKNVKKPVKRLNDFPFVSPPPLERQQQGTTGTMPGQMPGGIPTGP